MRHRSQRGAASLVMLLLLLVMVVTTAALLETLSRVHRSAAREQASVQALCLAESGVEVALHRLAAGHYAGEPDTPLGTGSFSVQVRRGSPLEVFATGEMPCGSVLAVRRSVRVRGTLSGGRFRLQDWREVPSPAGSSDSDSGAFQRRTP